MNTAQRTLLAALAVALAACGADEVAPDGLQDVLVVDIDTPDPDTSGDEGDGTAAADTVSPPDTASADDADATPEDTGGASADVDDAASAPDVDDADDDAPDAALADTAPADTTASDATGEPAVCAEFVVLDDDGRFRLEGEAYPLHGVNLHAVIGAVVTNADTPDLAPEDYAWEFFPAPYGNYFPDNHGICYSPWGDPEQCCVDAASCREAFLTQHVDRVLALGANSVRLVGLGFSITDDGVPFATCDRLWDAWSQRDQDAGRPCRLDLSDPALRARYLELVREVVRLLGERGIRTILLTEGKNADRGANHFVYLDVLEELGAALADEPWLLGYDPMNEPIYFFRGDLVHPSLACPGGGFCKTSARAVSKGWFDALTAHAPHHFVTVGQGVTTLSLIDWDPHVIFDHFTSWHVYPPRPWDEGAVPHGSHAMARQIYHAALGGCGRPCPFLGERDDLGCKVAEGPVAADGFIYEGAFYLPRRPTGPPCPVGEDDGANCLVARFDRGRDHPTVRRQPLFYVSAQAGTCPAGATFDGANCLIATGPIGASGFLYDPGAGEQFYWALREGEPPCAPPATFDGANCHVGPVPAGWSPFIVYRSHFYVDAITCWPRRPLHFGETGFSVFPNGEDLDPAAYQGHPRRWAKYQACVDDDGQPRPDTRPAGTEAEQIAFLTGDPAHGWPGTFPMSHACGFQGLHWWPLGGVNWGICREDNFGLYAFWYLKGDAPPGGDPRALVPRAAAAVFRDEVDYAAPHAAFCEEPAGFRATLDRGADPIRYRFTGRVLDGAGAPVANAMFYAWDLGWSGPSVTFSDADGHFILERPGCLVHGGATHFGFTNATRGLSGSCPSPGASPVTVPLGDFVIALRSDLPTVEELSPPRDRRRVCLVDDAWADAP